MEVFGALFAEPVEGRVGVVLGEACIRLTFFGKLDTLVLRHGNPHLSSINLHFVQVLDR